MFVLLLLFLASFTFSEVQTKEKRIVVVTASYNNKKWYKRHLNSIFDQKYDNWHLIYTDDCSPDGTGNLVEEHIAARGFQDKVTLIKNKERKGSPLANQYPAIMSCKDDDIIAILDGDDFFADDGVLAYLNEVYADGTVWITYGQFREYPSNSLGFCRPYPRHITQRNAYREYQHTPSHLRSYYAGLFKKIRLEDLFYEGEFFKACCDMSTMLPMIEMAGSHHKFISRVMVTYNGANDLNIHKGRKGFQRKMDLIVRKRARYNPLITLFDDKE